MLSTAQLNSFEEKGYLLLPDIITGKERLALIDRSYGIIGEAKLDRTSRFSTTDRAKIDRDYFLGSAETVRCFFEEGAFDAAGKLQQPRARSINKIGHALHDLEPLFNRFSRRSDFGEIARDLRHAKPALYQTMVIFKQPRIGGEVTWHQDATFFYTVPSSVITYWFALEDATLENGCLWVEPGGHKGPLRQRYYCENRDLRMETLSDQPWPGDHDTPMPVKAGSLLVFHGHLPHCSAPNRSMKSRLALTFHVVDAASEYAAENWLQRPNLGEFLL